MDVLLTNVAYDIAIGVVKPTWPYRESMGAVRFLQAEWCAFFVFFYTNIIKSRLRKM